MTSTQDRCQDDSYQTGCSLNPSASDKHALPSVVRRLSGGPILSCPDTSNSLHQNLHTETSDSLSVLHNSPVSQYHCSGSHWPIPSCHWHRRLPGKSTVRRIGFLASGRIREIASRVLTDSQQTTEPAPHYSKCSHRMPSGTSPEHHPFMPNSHRTESQT